MRMIPVILSGGTGSRLWPLSRELKPKQFLHLSHPEKTLLQETLGRLHGIIEENPIIVCNQSHRFIVAEQLKEIHINNPHIIIEPEGKNTAPAVAIAALQALQQQDAILLVLPADHKIINLSVFQQAVLLAAEYASQDDLVTFGITPNKAETGYGYIEAGTALDGNKAYTVKQFVEKPNQATAENYLKQGGFYWNSGMFMFKASCYLQELQRYAPDILKAAQAAWANCQRDLDFVRVDAQAFSQCPADSIDYAVMEHTDKAVVLPLDCGWSDVGSWTALWDLQPRDQNNNVVQGDVILSDTKNCYLRSEKRMLATVGIEDCIVVETSDAVLVANKNKSQEIKKIYEQLKHAHREEAVSHSVVYRPWGSYETLIEGPCYKVKCIHVNPGAKLSLQSHQHRSEHWVVVKGVAEVTRGEEVFTLKHDESTYIPQQTKHRLHNPGTTMLELIEVQSGEYVGEDDIMRYEDSYGRVNA